MLTSKRFTMTELISKRKSLPKKQVAGVHFAIPLDGEELKIGYLYGFPKETKVLSRPINKNFQAQKQRTFTQGRLKEISDAGCYFIGSPKNCCPNEKHLFFLTRRKMMKFHAKTEVKTSSV
jgi:hypothetical protein